MRWTGGEEAPEPASVRIPTPLAAAMRPWSRRTAGGPWTRRLRRYTALVAGAQAVRAMDQPAEERALFLAGIGLATLSRARQGSHPPRPRRPPAPGRARSARRAMSGGSAPHRMRALKRRHLPLVLGALGAVTLVGAALEFLACCLAEEAYERWRLSRRRPAGGGG